MSQENMVGKEEKRTESITLGGQGGNTKRNKCGAKCDVYSRVVGYHRPTRNWNAGKQSEFSDRVEYGLDTSMKMD